MPCPSETARSGEGGKVVAENTLIARVMEWSINPTSSETAWGDSDSGGYTNRKKARLDATGSLSGKLDDDDEVWDVLEVGDTVSLDLWVDGNDPNPVTYWHFPCVLIQNFAIGANMDTKEVMEWSADFGADGIFYRPGQSGAPTRSPVGFGSDS
jgi:hypothetical protein